MQTHTHFQFLIQAREHLIEPAAQAPFVWGFWQISMPTLGQVIQRHIGFYTTVILFKFLTFFSLTFYATSSLQACFSLRRLT